MGPQVQVVHWSAKHGAAFCPLVQALKQCCCKASKKSVCACVRVYVSELSRTFNVHYPATHSSRCRVSRNSGAATQYVNPSP
jgi:hypothetical protein